MLIDWFTVVAQIINFLLLVALMKHFLFGRLVRAIDEREKRIAGRLAEAEQKNREAELQIQQVHAQTVEHERRRDQMIAQAQRDADEQRGQMLQAARESVRKLEAKWHEDLDREKKAFLEEIRRRAGDEILLIVRRALSDLACSDVQHCAVQVFLEKLRSFDATGLREMTGSELEVLSAIELPEETQRQIRQALEKRLGEPVDLRFVRTPAMAWGIELRGSGRRMGWSADSYVECLEENLKEAMPV